MGEHWRQLQDIFDEICLLDEEQPPRVVTVRDEAGGRRNGLSYGPETGAA